MRFSFNIICRMTIWFRGLIIILQVYKDQFPSDTVKLL
jgi:hypothetical protein